MNLINHITTNLNIPQLKLCLITPMKPTTWWTIQSTYQSTKVFLSMSLTKFVMQSSTLLRRIVKKVFIHYNLKFYPNFDAFILFGHIFIFLFFLLFRKKYLYLFKSHDIEIFQLFGINISFWLQYLKRFFTWYFSSVTTISSGLFNGKLSKHWFVEKLEIFFHSS